MKKSIISILVVILLVAGLFILTGCENKNTNNEVNNNNETKSTGIDLKYDFEHINNKTYNAHINTSPDDKVVEFSEEEPNYVSLMNEKSNYILDLTLDSEAKEAYEHFKESDKEQDEMYEEVKFGKYEGYSSYDDGIYGYILLDDSDSTFDIFVMFTLSTIDDTSENNDINTIYHSPEIQNILDRIEYKN